MSFFSNLFKSDNTIPLLDEGEINALVHFYEKGWARRAFRQMGINDGTFTSLDEHTLIRGLKKRCLTAEEIRSVIGMLKMDMKLHGDDPDEKEIIRKLRACHNGLTQGEKAPEGRAVELLPCPICEKWAIMEKRDGKCLAGCPSCTVGGRPGSSAKRSPGINSFVVQEWPNEDMAIEKWNGLVNHWLEENGQR